MPGLILATVTPDNTPGGAVLTFAFPVGLFVVIAVILYLRFGRPHRRIPAALTPAATGATIEAPHPEMARGASVAAGLPTAVGGGRAESPVEPGGGVRVPEADSGTPGAGATAAGLDEPAAGTGEPAAGTREPAAGAAEPAGDRPAGGPAAGTGTSNVSGQDAGPADAGDPGHGMTDGTEASE